MKQSEYYGKWEPDDRVQCKFCKSSIKDSVFTWYNGNYDQNYHVLQDSSTERYVKFLALLFIKNLQV